MFATRRCMLQIVMCKLSTVVGIRIFFVMFEKYILLKTEAINRGLKTNDWLGFPSQ